MAWPQRTQLSAEQILGMKPEELQTRLDSAAKKEDVDALKTSVEESKTTLADIQSKLAALVAPKTDPPPPDPQAVLDKDDPTAQVLSDPAGFVRRATKPTEDLALQTRADVQEMRARQKYGPAFSKYGEAMVKAAENFPLAQRAQDNFWDWHVRAFMGDKYVKGEIEGGSYPSLLGGSSLPPGSLTDPQDPNKGLNPEVAGWLKERGVPLKDAAAIKSLMGDNGEPIDIERYRKAVASVA